MRSKDRNKGKDKEAAQDDAVEQDTLTMLKNIPS